MSYKLFRQLVFEHLRQYLVSFLLILLAQLSLVILLREKFGKVATVIELKPPTLQVICGKSRHHEALDELPLSNVARTSHAAVFCQCGICHF